MSKLHVRHAHQYRAILDEPSHCSHHLWKTFHWCEESINYYHVIQVLMQQNFTPLFGDNSIHEKTLLYSNWVRPNFIETEALRKKRNIVPKKEILGKSQNTPFRFRFSLAVENLCHSNE